MFECPNCNTKLRPGARFCGKCGTPIPGGAPARPASSVAAPGSSAPTVALTHPPAQPSAKEQTLPCPHCGVAVPASARFCGSCGKEIVRPTDTLPQASKPTKRLKKAAKKRNQVWVIALPLLILCCLAVAIPSGYYGWTYFMATATPSGEVEDINLEDSDDKDTPGSPLPSPETKVPPTPTATLLPSPTAPVTTTSVPVSPTFTATFTPIPAPPPAGAPPPPPPPQLTDLPGIPITNLQDDFTTFDLTRWETFIMGNPPTPSDHATSTSPVHFESEILQLRTPVTLVASSVISFTVSYDPDDSSSGFTFNLKNPEDGSVGLAFALESQQSYFRIPPDGNMEELRYESALTYVCRLEFLPEGEVRLVINDVEVASLSGIPLNQPYSLSFQGLFDLYEFEIAAPAP